MQSSLYVHSSSFFRRSTIYHSFFHYIPLFTIL
ncbi:hypothetical protein NC653_040547 [Populus alba x Populus x berolinensis]|uniref:Uncharacterized protein n=1 Tax=Populus alba x Populus x berolinensis TaxID=444605 RepID=A0AAD6L6G9_9ROSI|nr:hypothetical protein NC653_040547 [Populus alba x Populus x berolinensis]